MSLLLVKKEIWALSLCDLCQGAILNPKKLDMEKGTFALLHLFVYLNIEPFKILESSKVLVGTV